MSVSLNVLQQLNLSDEQLALLEEIKGKLDLNNTNMTPDQRTRTLSRILNSNPSASWKFSTDPTIKSAFLTDYGSSRSNRLTSTASALVEKVAKKIAVNRDPKSLLKKAKSINDFLSRPSIRKNNLAKSADETITSPPVTKLWDSVNSTSSIRKESRTKSRRQSKPLVHPGEITRPNVDQIVQVGDSQKPDMNFFGILDDIPKEELSLEQQSSCFQDENKAELSVVEQEQPTATTNALDTKSCLVDDLLNLDLEYQPPSPLPKTHNPFHLVVSPLISPTCFHNYPVVIRRTEFANIVDGDSDDPCRTADLLAIREEIDLADQVVLQNYRECQLHQKTSLSISFPELKRQIEMVAGEIFLDEQCPDPKLLLLVPLNMMTVPKWIPLASHFRIGRRCNFFLTPSRVISRNHCEIFHDIAHYYITDVGSQSGTYVNGTRLGVAGQISAPRALQHWDIVQIGIDMTRESDQLGNLDPEFKCAQFLVLYGYQAKATVALRENLIDIRNHRQCIKKPPTDLLKADKLQKLISKALGIKPKFPGSNTRIYIEFGDLIHTNAAGTAVITRTKGEPSYSAVFNNYRTCWYHPSIIPARHSWLRDIGLTRDLDKQVFLMSLARDSIRVYQIKNGPETVGYVTSHGKMKFIVEPADPNQVAYCEDLGTVPPQPLQQEITISIPLASPYLDASRITSPLTPAAGTGCALPSACAPVSPQPEAADLHPFYSIAGDLETGMLFFVRRFQNTRKQQFLGEGQVSLKKTKWGKQVLVFEARLPPPSQHDELLIMASLLALLHHMSPDD